MTATLSREQLVELYYSLPEDQQAEYFPDLTSLLEETKEDTPASDVKTAQQLGVESFVEYVRRVAPWFAWHPHTIRWARVLQRVADGEIKRLLLGAPPRYIKSTILQLFSAYYLSRFPAKWVGTVSYGAKVAEKNAGAARDFYLQSGAKLEGQRAAINEWHTGQGGGHWAAGMGGAMIGFGYDLGIIDDPVSGPEEVFSDVVIKTNWDFYQGKFWNRKNDSNSAIIVTHQRWPGKADLIGRVLELETDSTQPQHWHVVLDSAIKIAEPPELPASCTYVDDDRKPGEPLYLEKFPLSELESTKVAIGSLWWDAQQQQRPRARTGKQFQWEWFEIVDQAPVQADWIRYWDTAGTEDGGDFTAGPLCGRAQNGIYYFVDVARGQWGPHRRNTMMRETAKKDRTDGRHVTHWVETPTGQGSKDASADIVRSLEGFVVEKEFANDKPKPLRADPLAAAAKAGNVKIVRGGWNTAFLNELCDFGPGCDHDDQVDGAAGAYNKLAERAGRVWRTSHFSL